MKWSAPANKTAIVSHNWRFGSAVATNSVPFMGIHFGPFLPFLFPFPCMHFFYFSPPVLQSYVRSFSPFFTPVDNGNWRSVFHFFLGFVLHENGKSCPETILTLCAALAQHQPSRPDVRETAHEKDDWPFVYCLQAVRNWLLLLLQTMTDRDRVQEAIFTVPFLCFSFRFPPFCG